MKIPCPDCGSMITVNITGRKPYDVSVINVCDALVHSKTYRGAAEYYERITGTKISPALVHKRIGEEATRRGMVRKELVEQLRG